MIHLVYGGSGSGKSSFAEAEVMKLNSTRKIYVATMKIFGEEGRAKVLRHKKLREGKGFETVEAPENVLRAVRLHLEPSGFSGLRLSPSLLHSVTQPLPRPLQSLPRLGLAILLECLSNLVANEMFKDKKIISEDEVIKKLEKDLKGLFELAENVVIVSNNIFEDGMEYDEDTRSYMRALAKINAFVAQKAERVTEVVAGIPVSIK